MGTAQIEIPGFKLEAEEGEPPVRLKLECTIKVTDVWSGEVYSHKIPMATDTPGQVVKHLTQAIKHPRTVKSIQEFVQGRDGIAARKAADDNDEQDD